MDFVAGVGFRFFACGFRLIGGGFRGFRLLAGPNDNRPYHFCAKNEYIVGQFLAGGCDSRQRQVADELMGPM